MMAPQEHRDPGPRKPLVSVPGEDPFSPPRVPVRYAVFGFWHSRYPGEDREHHDQMCLGTHDTYEQALKHQERVHEYRNLRGLQLFSGSVIYTIPIRPLQASDLQFERLSEPPI